MLTLTIRSGDNVNGIALDQRQPDPDRLLQCVPVCLSSVWLTPKYRAYFHSASTLNCIRSLLGSGFADLHNPRSWSLSHVRNPELAASFESIVERLEDSLDFLKVIGGESGSLSSVDLYTSHEVWSVSLLDADTDKATCRV